MASRAVMTTEAAPELDLDAVVAPFRDLDPGLSRDRRRRRDADREHLAGTTGRRRRDARDPGRRAGRRHPRVGRGVRRRPRGGRGRIARGRARGGARDRPGDRGPARRGRPADGGGAGGRRLQRSFVSLTPPDVPGYDIAAHYEAARGRRRFLRPLPASPPRSPAERGDRGRDRKGIAAALLMAFVGRSSTPRSTIRPVPPMRSSARTGSWSRSGARRCSSPRSRGGSTSDRPPAPRERRPRTAADHPRRRVATDLARGAGPLVGAFHRSMSPRSRSTSSRATWRCSTPTGSPMHARPPGIGSTSGACSRPSRRPGGNRAGLITALADTVCAFQEPSPPVDDITIVAIRRLPAA